MQGWQYDIEDFTLVACGARLLKEKALILKDSLELGLLLDQVVSSRQGAVQVLIQPCSGL